MTIREGLLIGLLVLGLLATWLPLRGQPVQDSLYLPLVVNGPTPVVTPTLLMSSTAWWPTPAGK